MPKPQLVTSPEPPDLNAILEALRETMTPPDGGDPGYTTEELVQRTGRSTHTVTQMLKQLHAQGRLRVGSQRRLAFNGKMMRYTVYRVT